MQLYNCVSGFFILCQLFFSILVYIKHPERDNAMETIINLFESSVKKFKDNVYVYQKNQGRYKGYTYTEVHTLVEYFAFGLLKLGIKANDKVALLAEGQLNWVVSELGILYTGAVNVPLSIKLTEEEVVFRLKHSETKYLIVSSTQLKKLTHIKADVQSLDKVIVIGDEKQSSMDFIKFKSVIDSGKIHKQTHPDQLEKRKMAVTESSHANICYTSGTTADPKGIILTHRNYTANIEQGLSLFHIPENYNTLLILPWDHAFAHTVGIYALMKKGASISCVEVGKTANETLRNIPKNIKESKPVFLLSVPALAKNFRKNIEKTIAEKGGFIEKLFNYGLKLAYEYNGIGFDRGKGSKKLKWPMHKLIDMIIFKKIREGFGGKLEFFVGGGALLDIELQRFFCAIGMPMLQGYGLTEASPIISSNTRKKFKFGTSGVLVPNMELKICDEEGNALPDGEKGEIVIKGENVMAGYFKNDEATKESIKDNWLYTGDLGYMDPDGFLVVLGRSKSLLIADDGEKFSPESIEEAFADNSTFIEQVMLHNNQQPYTVALIVPNKAVLEKEVKNSGLDIATDEGLQKACKIIEAEVNAYRKGGKFDGSFPDRWLPAATAILAEAFTEENKLMNSTLKMVRPKITEKYKELIEFLYTPEAKKIDNKLNILSLKKFVS